MPEFLQKLKMGVCHSEEMSKQYSTNRSIEKKLQEAKLRDKRTIKLLLLGQFVPRFFTY